MWRFCKMEKIDYAVVTGLKTWLNGKLSSVDGRVENNCFAIAEAIARYGNTYGFLSTQLWTKLLCGYMINLKNKQEIAKILPLNIARDVENLFEIELENFCHENSAGKNQMHITNTHKRRFQSDWMSGFIKEEAALAFIISSYKEINIFALKDGNIIDGNKWRNSLTDSDIGITITKLNLNLIDAIVFSSREFCKAFANNSMMRAWIEIFYNTTSPLKRQMIASKIGAMGNNNDLAVVWWIK